MDSSACSRTAPTGSDASRMSCSARHEAEQPVARDAPADCRPYLLMPTTRPSGVCARDRGVAWVIFDRPEAAARDEASRDVDRGVTNQGADLDRLPRPPQAKEHVDQAAVTLADLDRGHSIGYRERSGERGVMPAV